MKNKLLFVIALTFTAFSFSQNIIEETKELFKIIKCKTIIENTFSKVKEDIHANEKEIFSDAGLNYEIKEDVKRFHDFLDEEISLFTQDSYYQIISKYSSTYSKNEVNKFIDNAKDKNYKKDILKESHFLDELELIINQQLYYLENDINLTITNIRAKYKPLLLELIINETIIKNQEIDLELILNTNAESEPAISILNKENFEINLPNNFNYDSIESLTIKYLGNEYIIERFNKVLPKEIQELSSPLAKYCFEELEKWTLTVNDGVIGLQTRVLTNMALK